MSSHNQIIHLCSSETSLAMLRVTFIFAFVALFMFGLASGAPKKPKDDEDIDQTTGMLFNNDEITDEREDEGDDGIDGDYDGDDGDAMAKVSLSDWSKVALNTNTIQRVPPGPTDLNTNGAIPDDSEEGSSKPTGNSEKQCKNTVTPARGCNKGSCLSGGGAQVSGKCTKPRSPKHGGISVRGSYVEYFCHHGYQLHGPKRSDVFVPVASTVGIVVPRCASAAGLPGMSHYNDKFFYMGVMCMYT